MCFMEITVYIGSIRFVRLEGFSIRLILDPELKAQKVLAGELVLF